MNDTTRRWMTALLATAVLACSASALALDTAYDRKGAFVGLGLGGGGGVASDGPTGLGDLAMDLQLGFGAGQNFTVSLDLMTRLELIDGSSMGLLVPGPRFAIFLGDNVYARAGMGLALGFGHGIDGVTPGIDVGAGVGVEHFVNTNLAAYLELFGDFIMLTKDPDPLNMGLFGLWIGIRYY